MSTQDFLNNQPGIRRINDGEVSETSYKHTPVNQQRIDSHVLTPMLIAFVVALLFTAMAAAIMLKWFVLDGFVLLITYCITFLITFLKRIGVADRVLWAIEGMLDIDLNGDDEIGYAPRSVTVNRGEKTRDMALPTKPEKLTRVDWQQVAIAILNKHGRVSRRGIYENSELSQSKATDAARHLEKGYATDGNLNGAGWDWLHTHLPDHVQCLMERPTDPPTPQNGGWGVVEGDVNQPTNQPTS